MIYSQLLCVDQIGTEAVALARVDTETGPRMLLVRMHDLPRLDNRSTESVRRAARSMHSGVFAGCWEARRQGLLP
jgi:hypothetical protein